VAVAAAATAAAGAAQAQLFLANQPPQPQHTSRATVANRENRPGTKEHYRMRRSHGEFVRKRNDHDEKFVAECQTDEDEEEAEEQTYSNYDSSDDSCLLRTILESGRAEAEDMRPDGNELTDFEKEVLRKYIGEIDLELDLMPDSLEKRLLADDNNNDIPASVGEMEAATSDSTLSDVSLPDCRSEASSSLPPMRRNSIATDRPSPRQRNTRVQRRSNLSVWVGVTSCVWGILLYLVRTYM
jgi:hypothetical protein